MPVTVVVGGQFGSEGKGKVAHFLAKRMGISIAVRVGGPNSGHTVIDKNGAPQIFQHLPTSAILPDIVCVLPPGSYINPDILHREIARIALPRARLIIDPNAVVISNDDRTAEEQSSIRDRIGSTAVGVGAAAVKRINRLKDTLLAKHEPSLRPYITDTLPILRVALRKKERILIEGTQGFGLSLLHSTHYPYVTSRDTTAAGFLSETGLSPLDVEHVVMVLRSYPIRVSGNSGPLPNETTWEHVTQTSSTPDIFLEHTSVTKSIRRVAQFDADIIRRAINVNNPSLIALNHLDQIDWRIRESGCSEKVSKFVSEVERQLERSIDLLGWSPHNVLFASELTTQVRQ